MNGTYVLSSNMVQSVGLRKSINTNDENSFNVNIIMYHKWTQICSTLKQVHRIILLARSYADTRLKREEIELSVFEIFVSKTDGYFPV